MKDLSQTQSLEDSKTVKNLANQSSDLRLQTQETLRQSEARDWVKRYRKKIKEEGKAEAYACGNKSPSGCAAGSQMTHERLVANSILSRLKDGEEFSQSVIRTALIDAGDLAPDRGAG